MVAEKPGTLETVNPTNLLVFRLAAIGWLIGWYAKAGRFLTELPNTELPGIDHPLFPSVFENPGVALIAYLLPILALWLLSVRRPGMLLGAAGVLLVASLVLMLHISTCNDATFVVSFWVALWLLWLAHASALPAAEIRKQGTTLASCILGVIFLGGAVGKFTAEYWNGDAFHQLYFQQKYNFPYPWLRTQFLPETLRTLATTFSRCAILGECLLALAPLYPRRLICIAGPLVMALMVAVSTWTLISVMAGLMGMMLACLLWDRTADESELTTMGPERKIA